MQFSQEKLTLSEIANALREVCDEKDSILFSAVRRPQSFSIEELLQQTKSLQETTGLLTFEDYLEIFDSKTDFLLHLEYFPSRIEDIERGTRGQSTNPLWCAIRKHVISASKAHEVKTRMLSYLKKGSSLQSIFDKISGKQTINHDIPALKYGREIEPVAVSHFESEFKRLHQNVQISDCDFLFSEGSTISCCQC